MQKVLIIAEAGVNHNGDPKLAKKLIDIACDAGVDAVKFQTFQADDLVVKEAPKAEYQMKNMAGGKTQYEMLKKLELSKETHEELFDYCKKKGILFLSAPFDVKSVEYLHTLGVPMIKIPSGEITNYPYLKAVGQTGRPVILSTGMSDLEEVREALSVLRRWGSSKITVLHCNTEYPTPKEDVNLKAMKEMGEELALPFGYSDHTLGTEVALAAVAMGASIIEKHFTISKSMEGPDHKASLEPKQLKEMVEGIRKIEKALGNEKKVPSMSERKNISVARKSIVAACDIAKGELLTEENLTTKRPGTGISPMKWEQVIGTAAKKNFNKDELIEI